MYFFNYDILKNLPAIGATVLLIAGVSSLTIILMRICEEERIRAAALEIRFEALKIEIYSPGRKLVTSAGTHLLPHWCSNRTCAWWWCNQTLHSFSSLDHFDQITLFVNGGIIVQLIVCILFSLVICFIWVFIKFNLFKSSFIVRNFLHFIFRFFQKTFKNWLLSLKILYFILFFIVFFLIILFNLSIWFLLFILIIYVVLSFFIYNTRNFKISCITLAVFCFLTLIVPEFFILSIQLYILYFIVNRLLKLQFK